MKLFPKKVDNRPTKDKRISVQLDQRRLKCVQIAPTCAWELQSNVFTHPNEEIKSLTETKTVIA